MYSRISKLGVLIGWFGIITSCALTYLTVMRYFVLFPDLDKLLYYSALGFLAFIVSIIFIFISAIYDRQRYISDVVYDVEEYLQDKLYGQKDREEEEKEVSHEELEQIAEREKELKAEPIEEVREVIKPLPQLQGVRPVEVRRVE